MRRANLGLTQEQLADRMGTSHSAISRIESGQHRTSVATLERLAEARVVRSRTARTVDGHHWRPPCAVGVPLALRSAAICR
jgi:transcriptional regulator with XRE-family HTH domain